MRTSQYSSGSSNPEGPDTFSFIVRTGDSDSGRLSDLPLKNEGWILLLADRLAQIHARHAGGLPGDGRRDHFVTMFRQLGNRTGIVIYAQEMGTQKMAEIGVQHLVSNIVALVKSRNAVIVLFEQFNIGPLSLKEPASITSVMVQNRSSRSI